MNTLKIMENKKQILKMIMMALICVVSYVITSNITRAMKSNNGYDFYVDEGDLSQTFSSGFDSGNSSPMMLFPMSPLAGDGYPLEVEIGDFDSTSDSDVKADMSNTPCTADEKGQGASDNSAFQSSSFSFNDKALDDGSSGAESKKSVQTSDADVNATVNPVCEFEEKEQSSTTSSKARPCLRTDPCDDSIASFYPWPQKKPRLSSSLLTRCVTVYDPRNVDGYDLYDREILETIYENMLDRPIIAVCVPRRFCGYFSDVKEFFMRKYLELSFMKPVIYFGGNVYFSKNSVSPKSLGVTELNAHVVIYKSSFSSMSFHGITINGMCIMFKPNMISKQCYVQNITKGGLFIVGDGEGCKGNNYSIAQEENVYYFSGSGLMGNRRRLVNLPGDWGEVFSDVNSVSFLDVLNFAAENSDPRTRLVQPSNFFANKDKKISPLKLPANQYVTIFDPASDKKYNPYDQEKLAEISAKLPGRTIIAVCSPFDLTEDFVFSDINKVLLNTYDTYVGERPIIYFGQNVHFDKYSFIPEKFPQTEKINADIIICGSRLTADSFYGHDINGTCIMFEPRMKAAQCFHDNRIRALFVSGDYGDRYRRYPIKSNGFTVTQYLFGTGLMDPMYSRNIADAANFPTVLSLAFPGCGTIVPKMHPHKSNPKRSGSLKPEHTAEFSGRIASRDVTDSFSACSREGIPAEVPVPAEPSEHPNVQCPDSSLQLQEATLFPEDYQFNPMKNYNILVDDFDDPFANIVFFE